MAAELSISHNVVSQTSNLGQIYEKKEEEIQNLIKNFKHDLSSNGIAIFHKEKLLSIDIFNRTDICEEYFPRLLNGAAIEHIPLRNAEKEEKGNKTTEEKDVRAKLNELLSQIEQFSFKEHHAAAEGKEKRYNDKFVNVTELKFEEHLIHLNEFEGRESNFKKRHPFSNSESRFLRID